MALATQLGAPSEVTIGTPALTFTDVVDAEFIFDPEIIEYFNGNSSYPRMTIGNLNVQIKFKTTDIQAFTGLIKGMFVETVQVKFKPTITSVVPATGALTQAAGEIGFTVSSMMVDEPITVTNDSSKKAAEYQLSFKACLDATGDEPELTFDLTLGA